jgi:hypothetical protein
VDRAALAPNGVYLDSRGKWMIVEAKRTLANSPVGHHRALAAGAGEVNIHYLV